jgi:hypothetical protein
MDWRPILLMQWLFVCGSLRAASVGCMSMLGRASKGGARAKILLNAASLF